MVTVILTTLTYFDVVFLILHHNHDCQLKQLKQLSATESNLKVYQCNHNVTSLVA